MSVLPVSQNKRRALVRSLMIVFGLVLVACALAARTWDVEVRGPMMALLIVFCVLAVLEFATFDEIAKRAHYIAWYWGSVLGFICIALMQVAFAFDGSPFVAVQQTLMEWFGAADASASFAAGMLFGPLLMAAGFFIVRGVDWLRSR
jgi:hypothetical protein